MGSPRDTCRPYESSKFHKSLLHSSGREGSCIWSYDCGEGNRCCAGHCDIQDCGRSYCTHTSATTSSICSNSNTTYSNSNTAYGTSHSGRGGPQPWSAHWWHRRWHCWPCSFRWLGLVFHEEEISSGVSYA